MDVVCNDCSVVVSVAALGSKVLMEKSGYRVVVDTVDIIGGIKLNVVAVSSIVDGVIVVTLGLAVFTSL